jgi:hypothetical protein
LYSQRVRFLFPVLALTAAIEKRAGMILGLAFVVHPGLFFGVDVIKLRLGTVSGAIPVRAAA